MFLYESGTHEAECSKKVVSGRRVACAIRSLVNARSLQFECARFLHETLLVPVLIYDSEAMIWREKERSRIRATQMESLRGFLGIIRMDKILNTRREFCGVTNGVAMCRE